MLIEAVRAEAKRLGCHQVTLTTTNDNIGALRFYQRRGFRLAAIRPGAVDRARRAQAGDSPYRGFRHSASRRNRPHLSRLEKKKSKSLSRT